MKHVDILGVQVLPYTIQTLNEAIAATIESGAKAVFPNINVYAANIACKDRDFRDFLNASGRTFCDGHGVILGARILGQHIPEKITYSHWFPLFCDFAEKKGFSIFLLGSKAGIAEQAKRRLCATRPDLKIVGTHDGYFDKNPHDAENKAVIEKINKASPDVLLVSFGMPLQEKWLSDNWASINARVALTGGAAIDYMAGVSTRPPSWLTATGFEWLGRMIYEPRRLWKRYLIGNPVFIARIIKQRFSRSSL